MPLLAPEERSALEDADAVVEDIQRALEAAAAAGVVDGDALARLGTTAREAAGRVNVLLPPHVDPAAADEIRRRLIEILTIDAGKAPSLDLADHVLLEMEAIRHVVRDLLDEQPPVELRDAAAVVGQLEAWLPGATVAELAGLLGCSERQLQRLRKDGGSSSSRMQMTVRLVAILRHAWTDRGVIAWFDRPRDDLGGERPSALLDDPHVERDLLVAARAGRAQGGA